MGTRRVGHIKIIQVVGSKPKPSGVVSHRAERKIAPLAQETTHLMDDVTVIQV